MKIALFEYTAVSMARLQVVRDESWHVDSSVVRVSEWIDAEFPPRSAESVLPEQIAALDAQITEVNAKAGKLLAELNARKQELLALTDQRVTA